MKPVVTFVVPVRHQDNATDWGALTKRLSETARSIAAQSSPSWRAIIVSNHGADLPPLPPGFEIERVSFPPNAMFDIAANDREAVYESVRLDKGRRVLAGMLAAGDTDYFMIVDDDDFVSRDIVDFVSRNVGANGWEIQRGWLWSEGSALIMEHNDFHNTCGTSLIVRSDLYQLPDKFGAAADDYIKAYLGSHRKISGILRSEGTPLSGLPFRGAIYRVGHSGAHSRSKNLLRAYLFNTRLLRSPRSLVRNMCKFRRLGTAKRREFFGK